jgi:hypothetical protein
MHAGRNTSELENFCKYFGRQTKRRERHLSIPRLSEALILLPRIYSLVGDTSIFGAHCEERTLGAAMSRDV